MRDGMCKPEDVAAKVACDYAVFQASQQAHGQEQVLNPPGMIYRECETKGTYNFFTGTVSKFSWSINVIGFQ
jgi:hypothetical protein